MPDFECRPPLAAHQAHDRPPQTHTCVDERLQTTTQTACRDGTGGCAPRQLPAAGRTADNKSSVAR